MRRPRFGPGLSRREFLAGAAATVPLLASACRRPPYDPRQFALPDHSTVALMPADRYSLDFADIISRGLREIGVDLRGKRVFLKPNMVES